VKKIVPSLLSADFWCLQSQLSDLKDFGIDTVHVDVMDGNFVPNISLGIPVVESLRKHTNFTLDVHLMISQPEHFVVPFKSAGADILTVHVEATNHIHRLLQQIRENGAKAGISLNPGTPLEMVKPVLPMVDLVLVMSVNPGFGGQRFIPEALDKIKQLSSLKMEHGYNYVIEVDGGINEKTAASVLEVGGEWLVSGSGVFDGDIRENLTHLRQLLLKYV
jgi:ribulose-phosphate 3-epimerase